ncbi:hypothetical protein SAMN05216389_104197 [Oceanobacillus limi]|uniref:Aminopeptidase n=1 Tax=Oceanobacillus limi TaxID=930131 RepID=A0A1I0B5T9_9BACI|nr:hypothetical protein [Oceanobacillus limi]SET02145.1 hypothetical protein SAMN05216389_104197 [Oceanobacillus limi]
MQIIDTYPDFPQEYTLENLRNYYKKYPTIFDAYFANHCQNTDERLIKAMKRYPSDQATIKKVHFRIQKELKYVINEYKTRYKLTFPIDVNLIVGAYGSNAYTHRQIIPDITFSLERLPSEQEPLRVIIAHEFGHASHNIFSDRYQIDWKRMQWEHPYIWLLQEGAATHFSRQVIPDLKSSVYFSYNNEGDDWLDFANQHKNEIIRSFKSDILEDPRTVFKEWFSINGGTRFGHTRLAYYIADAMFQEFVHRKGELGALLSWKENPSFFHEVEEWLAQF